MKNNDTNKSSTIYTDLKQFLVENPEWIDKNNQLPYRQDVEALCWLFNSFSIQEVYCSDNGDFEVHTPFGWWTEKVTHWRHYQPERLSEKTSDKEDAIV